MFHWFRFATPYSSYGMTCLLGKDAFHASLAVQADGHKFWVWTNTIDGIVEQLGTFVDRLLTRVGRVGESQFGRHLIGFNVDIVVVAGEACGTADRPVRQFFHVGQKV